MSDRPLITYIAFGGTIASVSTGGAGVEPSLRAGELLESLPGLAELAAIEAIDFPAIGSYLVTPAHMLEVARAVTEALAGGADGVVVTHGTDTIEETAYALALTVPRGRPVVLTGAMRNPTLLGPEGPANLLAAFRVAASPAAAGLGPVVVLNDEIHAARFATKSHTTKPSTFVSAGTGPLGEVTEGRVDVWFRPAWDDLLGLPETLGGLEVQLVRLAAGMDERLLEAAVAARPAGIVVEGTGGGHVPVWLLPALDAALAGGIPVVVASRGVSGATMERTYQMEGAELDLLRRGVLMAGRLPGHKARLRLLVGRALGREPRTLFPVY